MAHILFLMSDTGGGHRAAARAIEAALQERHPGQFTAELVDVWKDYMPFPLNTLPNNYSRWVNVAPSSYSAQFWIGDRLARQWAWSRLYCQQMYPRMRRLYDEHPADIVVCVHSVFVRPAVFALRRLQIDRPFITVITDYAWPTVLWYDKQVDRCLAPTEPAYRRGLSLGMRPEQMVLTGAPVHPKYTRVHVTKHEAREQLGWTQTDPVVLLVGGGDGMGPLVATARAVDARRAAFQQVVVAGRNQAMKAALDATQWQHPTRVYGFVDNLQVFMRAADLMITKAGPATITEAALIGTPMVISGAIKFQESPNVDYVVAHGAGVYAPGPQRVAGAVERLLSNGNHTLQELAQGVKKLAQPDAIWNIADEIAAYG
jgi:1,2-diacylglycerol 3-beta-galactosyltransferase